MRRYLVCLLLLLLGACATTRPSAPPVASAPTAPSIPLGKADVHIYRRAIALGPAVLSIYDGAHPLGSLPVGTYIQYYADPGPRSLKVTGAYIGNIPYATTFVAGHSYYFSVYFLGDLQHGNASLSPVDAAKAIGQMAGLKPLSSYSFLDSIRDHSYRLASEPRSVFDCGFN